MLKLVHRKEYILSQKVIPHVDERYAKLYAMPEGHHSMGIFAATNDDPCYIAIDDATKQVDIKVLRAEAHLAGSKCTMSKMSGCVYVSFSASTVEKVRTAMNYIREFVEHKSQGYHFEGIDSSRFYAHVVPKMGKYYSEKLGVPEGTSYAYFIGAPVDANYALDKALKSGNVELVRYFYPPSKMNSGGGIVIGSESACRAAKDAYIEAMRFVTMHKVHI